MLFRARLGGGRGGCGRRSENLTFRELRGSQGCTRLQGRRRVLATPWLLLGAADGDMELGMGFDIGLDMDIDTYIYIYVYVWM